jgi:hypothetical protein
MRTIKNANKLNSIDRARNMEIGAWRKGKYFSIANIFALCMIAISFTCAIKFALEVPRKFPKGIFLSKK